MEGQFLRRKNALFVCVMFLLGFFLVALFRNSFAAVDLGVNNWATTINGGIFRILAEGVSIAFDFVVMTAATVVLAAVFFAKHYKRYGLLLLGAMAGEVILVSVIKTLVASARPLNEIFAETNFSFPSGHVTGSVVFFGVLVYFAWNRWSSAKVRATACGLYVLVVSIVGFDRIYLNVHWFSDVVSAVFLGAFWLGLCVFIFDYSLRSGGLRRFLNRNTNPRVNQLGASAGYGRVG